MTILLTMDKWVSRAVMLLAKLLYIAMGASVFFQIVFRYGFNIGLNWVDEFARFLLVWVAFLGAGFAIDSMESTSVSFFRTMLPERIQLVLRFVFRLLILFLLGVLVHTGLIFAEFGGMQKTVALGGITLYWPHMAIPAGSAVMIFKWLIAMIRELCYPESCNACLREPLEKEKPF